MRTMMWWKQRTTRSVRRRAHRRGTLVPLVAVVACLAGALLAAPAVTAAGTLDQHNDAVAATVSYLVSAQEIYAQTFTAGITGRLDQVDLELLKNGPTGDLTVEIQGVALGVPSGTVLGGGTLLQASAPFYPPTFVAIPLSTPAPVVAGTAYAIVLRSSGDLEVDTFYAINANSPSTYAGGTAASAHISSVGVTGTWSIANDQDMRFRTYVTPPDVTKPVLTAHLSGTLGSNGWYTGPVSVTFTCADEPGGSGLATPASGAYGDTTLTNDGANQAVPSTGTCKDNAGNVADAVTASGINIDQTKPTVTYSGNASPYTVDQAVNITCNASDNLSGVASSTCAPISGPAYTFNLGTNANPYSATATDVAGNGGKGSTNFTVTVNAASIDALIAQFVTDPKVAATLQQANAIASAPNAGSKANKLSAFINAVNAQTGKSITPANAAILINLAKAL